MEFTAYKIEQPDPIERSLLVQRLKNQETTPWLILDTCQRLEVYGQGELTQIQGGLITTCWKDEIAFERLVRIAAGLDSRVLGELEILGQVRNAYKQFDRVFGGNATLLDQAFQEVLALARKARRESGIDQKLTSLSGLASRKLLDLTPRGKPVAVIGSGNVAGSVVRYLAKRGNSPVRVAGRCPDKAMQLALASGGFGGGLDNMTHLMKDVAGVIAATAAPHPVLFLHHLTEAAPEMTIIDLGVPPDCCDQVQAARQVSYHNLEDIEALAASNQQEREAAATLAEQIVREGSASRFAQLRSA